MSRASLTRVRAVSGFRALTSRPQASPRQIRAPLEMTIALTPARVRNARRSRPCGWGIALLDMMVFLLICRCLLFCVVSAVSAVALQNLDLVAVGVLDEEETRHQRALAMEFLDRIEIDPRCRHARMFGFEGVDGESDMAITRAQFVRLSAAVIDRQLHFERRLGVAEIDQGETFEDVAIGDAEAEGLFIERDRPRLFEHADHHVDRFSHCRAPQEGALSVFRNSMTLARLAGSAW